MSKEIEDALIYSYRTIKHGGHVNMECKDGVIVTLSVRQTPNRGARIVNIQSSPIPFDEKLLSEQREEL